MTSFDASTSHDPGETEQAEVVAVSVEWVGTAAVLTAAGELDMVTAPQLEEQVTLVLEHRPEVLVVDLTEVGFLASAGMAVLIGASKRAGEHTSFRVVAEGSATGRPLHLVGLDREFAVYPSRDEALGTDM